MEMEPPPWRWPLGSELYHNDYQGELPVRLGVMLLQIMAGRLVLLGKDEEVLDARYL
jgi:hypothetical protein